MRNGIAWSRRFRTASFLAVAGAQVVILGCSATSGTMPEAEVNADDTDSIDWGRQLDGWQLEEEMLDLTHEGPPSETIAEATGGDVLGTDAPRVDDLSWMGQPCSTRSDCPPPFGVCLSLGNGPFCTVECLEPDSCPPGWICMPWQMEEEGLCIPDA